MGIKILILEDDHSLGEALKEGLSRKDHEVTLAHRPDEALSAFSTQNFDYILIDCLLPQMTGIDFTERIKNLKPDSDSKIILMSGVYTDRAFIQEATQKSEAIAFLKKPFDLSELFAHLKKEESKSSGNGTGKTTIYDVFSKEKLTNRDKKEIVDQVEEIIGYDLPLIYNLLAETKSSGYLNLYNEDGSVSGVTFSSGSIISVDIEDKKTFLGEMLIQSGYITQEDLQEALKDKSKKKLGSRLIQLNFLSPHGLDLIMTEQMNVRLSRTITSNRVKVSFAASDVELIHPCIDSDQLTPYLHDWVASKLPLSWLKSLYQSKVHFKIVPSPFFKADHPALKMSLVNSMEGFVQKIQGQPYVFKMFGGSESEETALLKSIHFLCLKGLLVLKLTPASLSGADQRDYINYLNSKFSGKSQQDIIDFFSWNMDQIEEKSKELIQFLGKIPQDQQDLQSKFAHLEKALKATSGKNIESSQKVSLPKKNTSQSKTTVVDAETKFQANQLIEQVKKDLSYNQYQAAQEKLKEAYQLNPGIFQYYLYSAWIKLGLFEKSKKPSLKEIELDIMQIPPDERYDALYPFVMGLFAKAKGETIQARKSFEKALALDGTFLVARREMGSLEKSSKPKQDIFSMDLTSVVSGFFKKK